MRHVASDPLLFPDAPQSVSGVPFTDHARRLAALDERVRKAAAAAWETGTLPAAEDVLGELSDTPAWLSLRELRAALQADGGEAELGALGTEEGEGDAEAPPLTVPELSAALALAQRLLSRQRDETRYYKEQAASLRAAAAAAPHTEGSLAALAAARLELARTRELLTAVSAERDALRVRLQAAEEEGAPSMQGAPPRSRGHSGLLRAAAEELAAHAAAREAAAIAADEALHIASQHAQVKAAAADGAGSSLPVAGELPPRPAPRKNSAGDGGAAAARVRARMLSLSGEQDGTRSAE